MLSNQKDVPHVTAIARRPAVEWGSFTHGGTYAYDEKYNIY